VNPIPWMTYASIDFLGQCISNKSRVLEFGSGNSTIWWLRRGNSVVSLETNPSWSERIHAQIVEKGWQDRSELHLVSEISPLELSKFKDASFDLIVNDGDGDRVEIITEIQRLLSPKGVLVWDNSDRSEYFDGKKILLDAGFHELKFTGMGPINAYSWITSIFYRSFDSFHSHKSDPDFMSIKY
jgi:predicted O-methyltransferase YrrM